MSGTLTSLTSWGQHAGLISSLSLSRSLSGSLCVSSPPELRARDGVRISLPLSQLHKLVLDTPAKRDKGRGGERGRKRYARRWQTGSCRSQISRQRRGRVGWEGERYHFEVGQKTLCGTQLDDNKLITTGVCVCLCAYSVRRIPKNNERRRDCRTLLGQALVGRLLRPSPTAATGVVQRVCRAKHSAAASFVRK